MADMNWRDKDDLDLTSEDIDAMISEGQPVEVRGPSPELPSAARLITAPGSWAIAGNVKFNPRSTGLRVSHPVPVA
jgi:hypothetical protein